MPVTVSGEDVVLSDVVLERSAWCAVVYEFDTHGGGKAAYSGTTVRLVPGQPGLSQPSPMTDQGSGMNVALDLVPGLYAVSVSSIPPGWFLRSVSVDDQLALDGPVAIRAPGSTVVVTLSQTQTRIEGTVRDSRSMVFGGATVIVLPARMPEGILMPNRIRETRSNPIGVFVAEGLPPGDYLVAAVDDASAEGWQDPRVIAQLRTNATRVRIGEETVRSVEVQLRPIKK